MENNQTIGDVINSILEEANVNNQIEATLNLIKNQSEQAALLQEEIGTLRADVDKIKNNFDEWVKKPKEKKLCRVKRFLCCIKSFIPRWFWMLLLILLCAIVFIWAMLIFQDRYSFELHNNHVSIVLGFVGILATFIVIGNYAQVREVKDEFLSYKYEMEKLRNDNIHLSVGLNIIYANIRLSYKPIEAVIYYLNAIEIGLFSLNEIKDVLFCINEIKNIGSITIDNKTISYKELFGKEKRYALKADGISIEDFIEKIRTNSNYPAIKSEFEQLIK
jgi:hypothetical protein